jgi:glycerate kinase
MDILVAALGGDLRKAIVNDPLGRPVHASYALLSDGWTAIVEAAQASGLGLVGHDERDPWAASTRGTGELILIASRDGASKIVVTAGGSATMDGGKAAVEVLEEAGVRIDLEVVCDVRTTWEAAPRVYGPQKGADPAMVRRLERRLDDLARRAPRDPRGVLYTGSAGGLSGGLWAFLGARLFPGAAYVLDAVGFDEKATEADLVVCGEGCIDAQTLEGKVVAEVGARCQRLGIPVHAVAGVNALGPGRARSELALASVWEAKTAAQLEVAAQSIAEMVM